MTMWRMSISPWIPKATNTHSEYVTLIAFLLNQWLQQRACMLGYTYIACLVLPSFLFHFGAFSSVYSLTLCIFLSVLLSSFFIPSARCHFLMRDKTWRLFIMPETGSWLVARLTSKLSCPNAGQFTSRDHSTWWPTWWAGNWQLTITENRWQVHKILRVLVMLMLTGGEVVVLSDSEQTVYKLLFHT